MSNWIIIITSLAVLFFLVFKIKTSRRFNLFDNWLHHKLIKKRDSLGWQVLAFLNDPKLMVVWAVLLASALINNGHSYTAVWVVGTLGFTDLVGIFLKKLIKRKRPILASNAEEGYSFPSGHVLGATSMSLILITLFGKSLGTVFSLFVLIIWLMVVISRLSLKAHYPSDVIGATSLAICCFGITQQILLFII